MNYWLFLGSFPDTSFELALIYICSSLTKLKLKRWATHGGKTDQNAHPHMDYNNRIALVHNGTINNAFQLRSELQSKGIEFRSETDTEVLLLI